ASPRHREGSDMPDRRSRLSRAAGDASRPRLGQVLWAYGLTIAAVVAAVFARLPLGSILHGRAPDAPFFLPIPFAAWRFGVGPTLLAIVLSLASAWAFVIPQREPGYDTSIVLFVAVCVAMLVMARAARGRADDDAFSKAIIDSSDDAILTKDLDG